MIHCAREKQVVEHVRQGSGKRRKRTLEFRSKIRGMREDFLVSTQIFREMTMNRRKSKLQQMGKIKVFSDI